MYVKGKIVWMGVLIGTAALIFPLLFNSAQVIFHTLDKNSQCSPKHEPKCVLLVALDRRDYWASIDMNKLSKYFEM